MKSVSVNESRSTAVTNPFYGQYATMNGQVYKSHERTMDYSFQQLLTWTRAFGMHSVNVLLGHENYWNKFSYLTANRSNMLLPGNEELNGAVIDGSSASYSAATLLRASIPTTVGVASGRSAVHGLSARKTGSTLLG